MKSNVLAGALFVCGLVLLAISPFILFFGSVLCIGINDGEWGRIQRTGAPSMPEKLRWEPWQPYDQSIRAFSSYQPEQEKPEVFQYRKGEVHGWLYDFAAYEGKAVSADGDKVFPAIGPGWGARFHSIRVLFVLIIPGIGMLIASRFFRYRGNAVPIGASVFPPQGKQSIGCSQSNVG